MTHEYTCFDTSTHEYTWFDTSGADGHKCHEQLELFMTLVSVVPLTCQKRCASDASKQVACVSFEASVCIACMNACVL